MPPNDDLPQFIDDDDDDFYPSQDEPMFVDDDDDPPFDADDDVDQYESEAIEEEATEEPSYADSVFAKIDEDIRRAEEEALAPEPDPEPLDPLEQDVQEFLELTTRRPQPPPPESQSTFVNPALARVAATTPQRMPSAPAEWWLALRTMLIISFAAVVTAFIFNYWTPDSFLSDEFVANLQNVSSTQGPPTAVPSPLPTFDTVKRIGIITGHSGPPLDTTFDIDPGAVCDANFDGIPELTELDVNTSVTSRLAPLLIEAGYEVEMLNEWDARIDNYRGEVLISIHANTCENLGFGATGFNIQINESSPFLARDTRLQDCMVAQYANATGLPRHFGTSPDLVDYHVFRKTSVDTPTVLVELGFMFSDRQVLTERPDDMARGVFEGLRCFLRLQDPNAANQ